MEHRPPVIALVVPCYNEQEVLPASESELRNLLHEMEDSGLISRNSFVLYVDDGSRDATWRLIEEAVEKYPGDDCGLKLGHNAGHQYALLAGLEVVADRCDAAISIDADLQDDISVIPAMIRRFIDGDEIVYGVRESRETDSWFKRSTANSFYKIFSGLGVESVSNHADFRLMSARAIKELLKYQEDNIFLRGIVPRIGLSHSEVTYSRKKREAGETKYPLKKMINFALEGITSFSIRPVRLVFMLGVVFVLIAFAIFIYTICRYFSGHTIEGWASLMLSIWFCTGVLLVCLGIIGEYIGKIFIEVKKRPKFVIEKTKGL